MLARRPISREDVAVALLEKVEAWYGVVIASPDKLFETWASRLATIGKNIRVEDSEGSWNGVATGVQRDGALLVRTSRGSVKTVYAADVSIRGISGGAGEAPCETIPEAPTVQGENPNR
jgi:BirA family biotin operon repressor/biotin-[acetyl-CoA-carboxylase] ligase